MKIIKGARCGLYGVISWHVLRNIRQWKEIEGYNIHIDLSLDQNLYGDIVKGPNIWEYYFNQIDKKEGSYEFVFEKDMPKILNLYSGKNIRETLGIIYSNYIKYNNATQSIINKNLSWKDKYSSILGVHIRKTDKYNEEPESYPIDDKDVLLVVNKELNENLYDKIYLATDDSDTYDLFIKTYGDLIIRTNRIRSNGQKSIHHHMPEVSGYIKGLDAILDMESLASCKFLIKCTSNLSATSMIINQNLDCYNLNQIFRNDKREQESFNIYSKEYK